MAGQSNSATALSTLISEWESSAFEVSDDDIDDGIPFVNIANGVEQYWLSAGKAADAKIFTKLRAKDFFANIPGSVKSRREYAKVWESHFGGRDQ